MKYILGKFNFSVCYPNTILIYVKFTSNFIHFVIIGSSCNMFIRNIGIDNIKILKFNVKELNIIYIYIYYELYEENIFFLALQYL